MTNNQPLKILVIANDRELFRQIKLVLNKTGLSFNFIFISSKNQITTEVNRGEVDFIICEHPYRRILLNELVELVQEIAPATPLVGISNSVHEEDSLELLQQGFWDFLHTKYLVRLPLVYYKLKRESSFRRTCAEYQLRDSRGNSA